MQIDLPLPIAAYMAAKARLDPDAMLIPFANDAVVLDERRTHRGRAAIREWIMQAAIAAKAIPTVRAMAIDGGDHIVTAEISGDFPGSPVMLDFRFTLVDEHIARLEIA